MMAHPFGCGSIKHEVLPHEMVRDRKQHVSLVIHQDETLADVSRALAVNGFGVYAMQGKDGETQLCISQRWRVSLALKYRERAALTSEQRAAEDAETAAIQQSLASGRE
jgi:hypothetical protein